MQNQINNGFPIRVLSELTGVSATTLRAWERRYGVIKPLRTPKGHRVYNQDDLDKVRRIVSLLERNYTISKAVKALVTNGSGDIDELDVEGPWLQYQRRMRHAIEQFSQAKLDAIYNETLSIYPVPLVTDRLIRPVLTEIGDRWRERPCGIAEEHFFNAYLRNKIGARLHHQSINNRGNRMLVACLPGERHELGVLLFNLSLMSRGYRILYLGPDLPIDQIINLWKSRPQDAILLSGTTIDFDEQLRRSCAELCSHVSQPVFIGGELSEQHHDEWQRLGIIPIGKDYSHALHSLETELTSNSPT